MRQCCVIKCASLSCVACPVGHAATVPLNNAYQCDARMMRQRVRVNTDGYCFCSLHGPVADESSTHLPPPPPFLFAAGGHHRPPVQEEDQPPQALLRPQGIKSLLHESVVAGVRAPPRDKIHGKISLPSCHDGALLLCCSAGWAFIGAPVVYILSMRRVGC